MTIRSSANKASSFGNKLDIYQRHLMHRFISLSLKYSQWTQEGNTNATGIRKLGGREFRNAQEMREWAAMFRNPYVRGRGGRVADGARKELAAM